MEAADQGALVSAVRGLGCARSADARAERVQGPCTNGREREGQVQGVRAILANSHLFLTHFHRVIWYNISGITTICFRLYRALVEEDTFCRIYQLLIAL